MEYGFDHELTEKQESPIVFSPYVTLWAEGNYYILAKKEGMDNMEHFRIDLMKDIVILERGIDMIFGGFNPGQYAKEYIFQNGEKKEKYEIECRRDLWQNVADTFGKDAVVMRIDDYDISIKIMAVPSQMKSWVLQHIEECDVTAPRKFREEIQKIVMGAYKKYC